MLGPSVASACTRKASLAQGPKKVPGIDDSGHSVKEVNNWQSKRG